MCESHRTLDCPSFDRYLSFHVEFSSYILHVNHFMSL